MRKEVGLVTEAERDDIQDIFDRQNGLKELAKILTAENNDLYEKLLKDVVETNSRFQNWWDTMAAKYQWESTPNGHWEIDFKDCKIFLVDEEQ